MFVLPHPNTKVIITPGNVILIHTSCTGDDGQWILGRTVHEWQTFRFIPQSLICSHEDVHETVGRIEDVLEFAVGVR